MYLVLFDAEALVLIFVICIFFIFRFVILGLFCYG